MNPQTSPNQPSYNALKTLIKQHVIEGVDYSKPLIGVWDSPEDEITAVGTEKKARRRPRRYASLVRAPPPDTPNTAVVKLKEENAKLNKRLKRSQEKCHVFGLHLRAAAAFREAADLKTKVANVEAAEARREVERLKREIERLEAMNNLAN
ncbi:hypothetical protein K435DRAFT_812911 [Dendrothele bispora CBS 962.96]|uniref:Uncharacterized protein n=1 Tax=Dendrothele bispora (strain CBS 962.96) TaxID=1314807 RepID=A0A4S8KMY4_DENBC|nr:hypothetical protein K435DRAFT_812911 [Dendrothele bispora CBS 962.96]